jgi:mono/diheme cytochrome c family protein
VVRRAVLAALILCACSKKKEAGPPLAARVPDVRLAIGDKELTLTELLALAPAQTITTQDDQYGKKKRFKAMALAPILDRTLGQQAVRGSEVLMRATDGYVISIAGTRLYDGNAFLAFDDVDVPGFEAIGNKQVNPGPFYLIWPKDEQHDLVQWPRPYQLASIVIATYASRFPHTLPQSSDEQVTRGFEIFKSLCVHCHAINREGGRVGPDLNVPKNVSEYWSEENLRAYIKNPQTFRYGNMPANPQLDERDLDGVLAYLKHMGGHKFEP